MFAQQLFECSSYMRVAHVRDWYASPAFAVVIYFFHNLSFLFISLYPINLLACQGPCCLRLGAWGLPLASRVEFFFFRSSSHGPRPGRCGPGLQVYESRMSSMIFKLPSVASTQKTASPAMSHQARQSSVSWSLIALMFQKRSCEARQMCTGAA